MKKIYCSHYKDKFTLHCTSCHGEDQFLTTRYKQFEIVHCCESLVDIKRDIDYHDEGPENNCE